MTWIKGAFFSVVVVFFFYVTIEAQGKGSVLLDGTKDNPRLVSPKDGAEYIALFK